MFEPLIARRVLWFLSIVLVLCAGTGVQAGRRFGYSYESKTEKPGEVEIENWVTWKTSKHNDTSFDRLDFRHEVEFGVTERLQLSYYFDWRYEDGSSVGNDGADFRDVAIEAIYNLADRKTQPLGLAIYGETKLGDELFELEGKIIVDKEVDNWLFVYNATIEAEWEGEGFGYHESKGEFEQTFGVSSEIADELFLGVEVLHEVEFGNWSQTGHNVLYVGPNLSFEVQPGGGHEWWATISPLFQATDVDGEPDFQVRLIFGYEF